MHNLLQVSPRIYSGSEPHGEEAFANLAQLGVKTIVSVDGARPNVELAHRYGLHYVHIPIGYDGLPQKASDSLARVARDSSGPVYVHCHHGQHRGPAAAAVLCIAAGETSAEQAHVILEMAGTGRNYPGLWRDVAGYQPPPRQAELPKLVEVAEVESFAAAMAKIDRNFDNLKLCQQSGWSVPGEHADVVPAQEALILQEGLREALRNLTPQRDPQFRQWLSNAAEVAETVEQAIRRQDMAGATRQFEGLEQSCKRCHAKYRNG